MAGLSPAEFQSSSNHVRDQEGSEISDVSKVVDRRPAAIHTRFGWVVWVTIRSGVHGDEGFQLPGQAVEEAQFCHALAMVETTIKVKSPPTVTLNLFVLCTPAAPGSISRLYPSVCLARWMLNRVQHDVGGNAPSRLCAFAALRDKITSATEPPTHTTFWLTHHIACA